MAAECTNHNWTEWTVKDSVTHSRHCQNEGCYATEYEEHYGGKATCGTGALCAVCGYEYTEPLGNHTMGDWYHKNETHDMRECSKCAYFEITPHNFNKTVSLDAENTARSAASAA